MERHAQRRAARRGGFPDPVQHLPGPAGPVRRDSSDPGVHPRGAQGTQPGLPRGAERSWREPAGAATAPRPGQLRKQLRSLPSADPDDPGLPAAALRAVRRRSPARVRRTEGRSRGDQDSAWRQFLRDDLKLELSQDKTLITHARTGAARFLGYEITVQHDDSKITGGRRSVNGADRRCACPRTVIKAKCAPYLQRGKPARRPQLINATTTPSSAPTGPSTGASSSTTCWPVMSADCTGCTGSWRPRCSRPWPASTARRCRRWPRKYKAKIDTPHGPRTCFEASVERDGRKPLVARFGGIPLNGRRTRSSPTADRSRPPPAKELITRLLADRCEICEQRGRRASPPRPQARRPRHSPDGHSPRGRSSWPRRRRKTLVVSRRRGIRAIGESWIA